MVDNRCLDDPRNRRLTRGGHPSSMDPGGARAAREYRTRKKVIAITDLHRSRLEHLPDHRFAEAVANQRDAVPCEAAPSSERRCFAPLPSLGLSAESLRLVTHSLDDDSDRSIAPSTAIAEYSECRALSLDHPNQPCDGGARALRLYQGRGHRVTTEQSLRRACAGRGARASHLSVEAGAVRGS